MMEGGSARRAVLLLAAVACLAGCRGREEAPPPAARAAGAAAAVPERVLAEAWSDSPRLRVQVLEVARPAPEILLVTLRLQNPDVAKPADLGGRFADDSEPAAPFSGLVLLDEGGLKRAHVMRDDKGRPACSTTVAEVAAGGRLEVACRFPSPSAGARRVGLQIPGLPAFRDLTVTEAPPPLQR